MTNLRWVDLGVIDPKLCSALWEFSRIYNLTTPTVFSFTVNKLFLENCSKNILLSDIIYTDNIPVDYHHNRYYMDISDNAGIFTWDKDVLGIFFHKPINYEKLTELKSIIYTYRKKGIDCFHTGNDGYIVIDGKIKKFCGVLNNKWDNNWAVNSISITYDVDIDLLNSIYNFDDRKLSAKNPEGDIGNIICGLNDASSSLIMKDDCEDIINEYAKRFNLSVIKDSLTIQETNDINSLANKLDNVSWKNNLIYPRR